ncbi:MAG: hypothetical protein JSR36_14200 [Proteobacteria bacterium]|nr:hypothetical protein [Pseudomonadota bacterium]
MNETQIIRRQLGIEREHLLAAAAAVAAAPGTASDEFRRAASDYLACVLGWYEARDQRLEALAARLGAQDPRCCTILQLLSQAGHSGEALALLAAQAWPALAQFLRGPWSARRDALEQLLANDARAPDWRTITGIDADGILAERTGYRRLAELAPPGLRLGAAQGA